MHYGWMDGLMGLFARRRSVSSCHVVVDFFCAGKIYRFGFKYLSRMDCQKEREGPPKSEWACVRAKTAAAPPNLSTNLISSRHKKSQSRDMLFCQMCIQSLVPIVVIRATSQVAYLTCPSIHPSISGRVRIRKYLRWGAAQT